MTDAKNIHPYRQAAGRPVLAATAGLLFWVAKPEKTEALTDVQRAYVESAIDEVERLTPVAKKLVEFSDPQIFPEDVPRERMADLLSQTPSRLRAMVEQGRIQTMASHAAETESGSISESRGALTRGQRDDLLVLARDAGTGNILASMEILPGAMVHEKLHFDLGWHSLRTGADIISSDTSLWDADAWSRFAVGHKDVPYMGGDYYFMARLFSEISHMVPEASVSLLFEKYPDAHESICGSCGVYGIDSADVRTILEFTYQNEREWHAERELAHNEEGEPGMRR